MDSERSSTKLPVFPAVFANTQVCYIYLSLVLQLKNQESNLCLDTLGNREGKDVGLYKCHSTGGNQVKQQRMYVHIRHLRQHETSYLFIEVS